MKQRGCGQKLCVLRRKPLPLRQEQNIEQHPCGMFLCVNAAAFHLKLQIFLHIPVISVVVFRNLPGNLNHVNIRLSESCLLATGFGIGSLFAAADVFYYKYQQN
jgi:hypothetical protein